MFAFLDNKAKADFKVLEYTKTIDPRNGSTETIDVSQYIDDADNYAIISCAEYAARGSWPDGNTDIDKWLYHFWTIASSGGQGVSSIEVRPNAKLYNSDSKRYLFFKMYNYTDRPRDIKIRFVLMRVGDVITL